MNNNGKPRKMTADSKSIHNEIEKSNEWKELFLIMEQSKKNLQFLKSQFRIINRDTYDSYRMEDKSMINENDETSKCIIPITNILIIDH